MNMVNLCRDLNIEQAKVVRYENGPLLVIAGPGTGKTTVLTRHLAYLVKNKFCQPEEILALTFTQKAAQEMIARTDDLFLNQYLDLPIHTFHSFAQQIIERHGLEIGLPSPCQIATDQDLRILLRQNWSRFKFDYYRPRGNNNALISALIAHFGRCKDEAIGPEDYLKSFKNKSNDKEENSRRKELASAYKAYQELLLEKGVFDFGDLLYYMHELLKQKSHWRDYYQNKIKYLLVDEFQDTNKIQYELIRLLLGTDRNITVCASIDQTIYQWRGAYYGNVDQFLSDYPDTKKIVLKNNYRSTQNLIDLSQSFMNRGEKMKSSKEIGLKAVRKERGIIEVWRFNNKESEFRGIAEEIVNLIQKRKIDPSQIAILTRTNDNVSAFVESLRLMKIPVQAMASGEFYRQSIILDLMAYLTLRINRYDDVAFYRYLNFPCWQMEETEKGWLMNQSRRRGYSLAEIFSRVDLRNGLSDKGIMSANRMMEYLDQKMISPMQDTLDFLETSGYLKTWLRSSPNQSEAESLNYFLDKLNEFSRNHPDLGLNYFLEQIEWERDSGGSIIEENIPGMVRIMTIHGAKGLEFDYVFLVNLVDQVFPSKRQHSIISWFDEDKDNERHLEEERRLFFVAMTRARQGLYFTWAEDHGGQRLRKPSRFLIELGLDNKAEVRRISARKIKNKINLKESYPLPDYFSYTQLASFENCPYQYKLAHILKVSTKGGPERSFGTTLHQTLAIFAEKWMRSNGKINWSELKQIYKECWLDDWYYDDNQRRQYKEDGHQGLRKFYQRVKKEMPQIYETDGNLWLEKEFRGKLAGHPFRGKIDRVDITDDGLELIDYKTGRMPKKILHEHKEQLFIYQLVAERILGIKPVRLTLDYVIEGQKVSFKGLAKDLLKSEENLSQVITRVKESEFNATPGFNCRFCDYRTICSFRK